jgi:SIR2-like domain
MPDHDPVRFATDLSAKLATRSRHVCMFFGAGVGCSCGLPDVAKLQGLVLSALDTDDATAFRKQLDKRNLEQALSRLRRMAVLLSTGQSLDDLTSAQATALDRKVCQEIVKALEIKSHDLTPVEFIAAWAGASLYHQPVEIFTVNYDLLFETALDRRRVPYFDGFVGTLKARFHTELVESSVGKDKECVPAFFVRLWKLHGSVNWLWETPNIVRLGQPVSSGVAAAIYPSDAKYDESRRVPFVVLQDRFRRALQDPETVVIISGYSFADEHLNELIFEAAARRERSEFVAFCHSNIPDELSKRAVVTPNLQVASGTEAILGGVRGNWKAPAAGADVWDKGSFTLRDFRKLAEYLARSAAIQPSTITTPPAVSAPAAPAPPSPPSTTVI